MNRQLSKRSKSGKTSQCLPKITRQIPFISSQGLFTSDRPASFYDCLSLSWPLDNEIWSMSVLKSAKPRLGSWKHPVHEAECITHARHSLQTGNIPQIILSILTVKWSILSAISAWSFVVGVGSILPKGAAWTPAYASHFKRRVTWHRLCLYLLKYYLEDSFPFFVPSTTQTSFAAHWNQTWLPLHWPRELTQSERELRSHTMKAAPTRVK